MRIAKLLLTLFGAGFAIACISMLSYAYEVGMHWMVYALLPMGILQGAGYTWLGIYGKKA